MKHPLMKCGHSASATTPDNKPVCAICFGITPDAEIELPAPDLSGRKAICEMGKEHAIVASSLDLPFFSYRPNKEYDTYYCGCCGWD